MNGTFQLRRGTAAQWTTNNPVLLPGEVGYETDTGKIKIGDAVGTAWTSLDYAGIPGETGDQGPPGNVQVSVTLDFGSTPVYSKSFSFSDGTVTTSSKILMAAAASSDEYEMDGFSCSAYCAVDGTITAFVHALPGPVTGGRTFNYVLG